MKKILFILAFGLFFLASYAQQTITPATALDAYINNGDPTYAWEVRDSYSVGKTKAYSILLISQKWQGILWKHELIIFVPEKINHDGALLYINGGALKDGVPNYLSQDDATSLSISAIAAKNHAITAMIRQVPNQPLYGGMTEDELISHTFSEFFKDGDYSWPLLFPMVKSARKAMDVVQEFSKQQTGAGINRFVVTGFSKRGWTTWLTAASQDQRVAAIAPMVIEMLNMPATLTYQKEIYGEYSDQIGDYVSLDLPQAINTEIGKAIAQMVDPYSYRTKMTMPKLIFMGTNDEYWTIDAVKHYIYDIPGQNYLSYVPNAGHSLGDKKQAFGTLSAFFGFTLDRKAYPVCEWNLTEKGKKITLDVKASGDQLARAVFWSAESDNRDFRKSLWKDKEIVSKSKSDIKETINYPKKGFSAFYIELVYKDPKGGEYSMTTRTYVADTKQVFVE